MTRRFRVIVVGLGGMSKEWLKYAAAHPNTIEIVALVDVVPQAAEQRAREFELNVPIYTTLTEAIQAVPADLVWDITLPVSRESVVAEALSSGLDVFSEKPMADSWEAAVRLRDLAKASGGRFLVMQNRRYHPQIRQFRDLVQSGIVGRPGFAAADFFLGPHFGGFRETMSEPLLLDMAIHTFDQARFLLGSNPTSVYCHAFNPPGSWYQGHAAAIAIFEWADQMIFEYRGSWAAEGAPTSWESNWRITGSRGTLIWDGANPPYAEVVEDEQSKEFMRSTRRQLAMAPATGAGGHGDALDAMMAALELGTSAETECFDNVHSLSMVFGAIQSAERGQKILLPEGLEQSP